MNFNLGELESLFEEIKDIIDYVETANLNDRRITLYLSSGNKLTYSIPNTSVPHLLGIDTNYLVATGLFKSNNSFEILKEIVENPYRIHTLNKEGRIDYKNLFSEHIKEKIASFKENIKINLFETEFVCEYDKNKSYYNSDKNEKCDYIIVKKYEDDSIGVIYLAKNNFLCVPMSNRIFKNITEAHAYLAELLKGQEITILNGNTTYNVKTDYKKSFYLPLNYKSEKINELKKYKKLFNCSIDIVSDYEHILDKVTSNRDTFNATNDIVDVIVNAIVNKTIINRDLYTDSSLLSIIDACNDHLCNSDGTAQRTYTSVIQELSEFKEKVLEISVENEMLEEKVENLTNTNEQLIQENQEHKEREKQILKILKPEN